MMLQIFRASSACRYLEIFPSHQGSILVLSERWEFNIDLRGTDVFWIIKLKFKKENFFNIFQSWLMILNPLLNWFVTQH